jgi:hypothetical protein
MENEKLTDQELITKIRNRQKQFETIRLPWEPDWQEIAELVQPRREALHFSGTKDKGKRSSKKRYDGTPTEALQLLADGLMGYLVSPSLQWFRLKIPNEKVNDMPEVKEWLQAVERQLYSEFARSNFYEEMHAYFLDGGSIGTATIYQEEDLANAKIVFSTRHPREIYIAENRYGMVDTVHRKYDLSIREIVKQFGKDNLTETQLRMYEDKPDEEYELLHAVFPNEDTIYGNLTSKNKPFSSLYLFAKTGDDLLRQAGYDENPYAVWRWRKNSTETYGRSPAHDALVDIQALNQVRRDLLHAGNLSVNPPMNIPSEMKFHVRLTPAGENYYKDAGRLVSPVYTGINYPIGKEELADFRQIIKKHFRVEFFLMLAEAQRQMTATEIVERQGEKAAVLGATIGRLNTECMNPIIDRAYRISSTAGRTPPPPEALLQYGGDIEIDYLGPLAQAQKRLFKTQGVMRSLEAVIGVAKAMPSVLDNVDQDEVARLIMDSFGMPAKAIKEQGEVDKIRELRQQQLEKQEKMAQMAEMSKAVPNLQKASEEGSPMDRIEQQQ